VPGCGDGGELPRDLSLWAPRCFLWVNARLRLIFASPEPPPPIPPSMLSSEAARDIWIFLSASEVA